MSKVLNKEMFDDVVIFSFSEPGAMGPKDMTFYKKSGEAFSLDYRSEDTPYSLLKELFPVLQGCYWNGPAHNEPAAAVTIVVGGSTEDKETHVADGWRHLYLDFGNHIAVKAELYPEVRKIFKGESNCDITFGWVQMLEKAEFADRVDDVEKAYIEQKKADVLLAEKIAEANENPEYRKKMAEASDMEKLMDVLEEFTGIRMDWLEFKQFCMRERGLI